VGPAGILLTTTIDPVVVPKLQLLLPAA